MLYYGKIGLSRGIDLAKSNNSEKCMIWHYCFSNNGFEFQDSVCDGCRDLTMIILNVSDIVIITVKNVSYRCIIQNISKSEAINLLKILRLKIVGIYKKI